MIEITDQKDFFTNALKNWIAIPVFQSWDSSGRAVVMNRSYCEKALKYISFDIRSTYGNILKDGLSYNKVIPFISRYIPNHNIYKYSRFSSRVPPSLDERGIFLCPDREPDLENPSLGWKSKKSNIEYIELILNQLIEYYYLWKFTGLYILPIGFEGGIDFKEIVELTNKKFHSFENVYFLNDKEKVNE